MWIRDLGTFPVDFLANGDEFEHHLGTELDQVPLPGWGSDGKSPAVFGPISDSAMTSRLEVRPSRKGVQCVVLGAEDEELVDKVQVKRWLAAVRSAVAAIGARDQEFAFHAVIGPAPRRLGFPEDCTLVAPCEIGPLRLFSGGVCMREYTGDTDRFDQPQGFWYSVPVIVEGEVSTYTWEAARVAGEKLLRRTCSILSLVTGEEWIPRTSPTLRVPDTRFRVPAVSPHAPHIADLPGEPQWDGTIPQGAGGALMVPKWATEAWGVLEFDLRLAEAVSAHYESLSLQSQHPTMSYLGFVATIEGFGKPLVPDSACTCVQGCTHKADVASARFRAGLSTVIAEDDVKKFAAFAYNIRSSTGHQGTLFAGERVYGLGGLSMFTGSPDVAFSQRMLRDMRNISRAVLTRELVLRAGAGQQTPDAGESSERSWMTLAGIVPAVVDPYRYGSPTHPDRTGQLLPTPPSKPQGMGVFRT